VSHLPGSLDNSLSTVVVDEESSGAFLRNAFVFSAWPEPFAGFTSWSGDAKTNIACLTSSLLDKRKKATAIIGDNKAAAAAIKIGFRNMTLSDSALGDWRSFINS
jgi:hypothetical protein